MGLAEISFRSAALDRQVTYAAIVPETGAPPFAVLYQLHGHSDDHRAWLLRSTIAVHAERYPLLVILPSGENSYYAGAYEQLIVRDLPAHVARTFQVRPGKAAIGGLSMGGYGAIRIGLKHRDRFQSIAAHSSRLPARDELPSLPWAKHLPIDDLDVDMLAQKLDKNDMPALTFDCGVDDHLLTDSRRFHAVLERLQVPHEYREYPGAHTWDYWDARIAGALAHHARALGLG